MKLWSTKWDSRGFRWYRWLVWFWWAKVRRRPDTVCRPDCPLCEVQVRIEAHYDGCAICQGPNYPCEAMTPLREEEDRVTEELFPWVQERNGTATLTASNGTTSSIPVKVFPPWDWSK